MRHPDIDILERLAGDRSSLPGEVYEETLKHIEFCPGCASSFRFFESVYSELKEFVGDSTPAASRLVDRLFPRPRVVELYPLVHGTPDSAGGHHTVVLAAASVTPRKPFVLRNSLVSSTGDELVRMIEDAATGAITVYLHTRERSYRAYAIITFPDLPADIALGPSGSLEIPESDSLRAMLPSATRALARYPCVESDADLGCDDCSLQCSPGYLVDIQRTGETVMIRITLDAADMPPVAFAAFAADDGRTTLVPVRDGFGSGSLANGHFRIRLYS
jgi:hypothetical protein